MPEEPLVIAKGNCAQAVQFEDGWIILEPTPEYEAWRESIFGPRVYPKMTFKVPHA